MRKFLLAATILAPFAIAPAFADGHGGTTAGNLTGAVSISTGGVLAGQSTKAGAITVGNGSSFQSVTAGNAAAINTSGTAMARPCSATPGKAGASEIWLPAVPTPYKARPCSAVRSRQPEI